MPQLTQALKDVLRKASPALIQFKRKLTARRWPKRSIVLYIEKYRPVLPEEVWAKGASGTQAAVAFLSEEWTKKGYEVTIFAGCQGIEGNHNGVNYVNYYKMNWQDHFETLIICRHPIYLRPNVRAERIFYEWQDIRVPETSYVPETLKGYDKIFCKSHFQRRLIDFCPDEQCMVVSNGVDSSLLNLNVSPAERSPHRLVYASRYYRGLEDMLIHGWPIIKAAVPAAELHLYYGFTKRDEDPDNKPWRDRLLALIESSPDVTDHGMVGYQQLMAEKARSTIQYYACTYEEVDCISVRESAVVGCVPVVTDFAVFIEKDYCVKVGGPPSDPATQRAVAEKVVELLQNPDLLAQERDRCREIATKDTWERSAAAWLEVIESN